LQSKAVICSLCIAGNFGLSTLLSKYADILAALSQKFKKFLSEKIFRGVCTESKIVVFKWLLCGMKLKSSIRLFPPLKNKTSLISSFAESSFFC